MFGCILQLVWLGINAFLFVHFYMAFLVERWYYTRVLLGVSPTCNFTSVAQTFTPNWVGICRFLVFISSENFQAVKHTIAPISKVVGKYEKKKEKKQDSAFFISSNYSYSKSLKVSNITTRKLKQTLQPHPLLFLVHCNYATE